MRLGLLPHRLDAAAPIDPERHAVDPSAAAAAGIVPAVANGRWQQPHASADHESKSRSETGRIYMPEAHQQATQPEDLFIVGSHGRVPRSHPEDDAYAAHGARPQQLI